MPPVWINYLLITYGPLSFDYLQVLKFSDIIILHIVSFVFECVHNLIGGSRQNVDQVPSLKNLTNFETFVHFYSNLEILTEFQKPCDPVWIRYCNLAPTYFRNYFTSIQTIHDIGTRQSLKGDLFALRCNATQHGLRSIHYTCVRLWNSLPFEIRDSPPLPVFRKKKSKPIF